MGESYFMEGRDKMEALIKNAMNQVPEGAIIFKESDIASYIGLVLRGRVEINSRGSKVVAGAGTFIGVSDIVAGRYQATYKAIDGAIVYVFEISKFDDLKKAVAANKDYGGFLIASQARYIKELDRIREELASQGEQMLEFINDTYKEFVTFSVRSGYPILDIPQIQELMPVSSLIKDKQDAIEYYVASSELPLDLYKSFYSNNKISVYAARQQVDVVNALVSECNQMACLLVEALSCLYSEDEGCLLRQIIQLIKDLSEDKNSKESISHLFDRCIEKINVIESVLSKNTGFETEVDHEFLENAYYKVLSGNFTSEEVENVEEEQVNINAETVMQDVRDSLNQILKYAGEADDFGREFSGLIDEFIRLEDKSSTEDNARKIRRRLSDGFYKIYEKVFKIAYQKNETNQVINMFLNFGFIDERLLTTEQIMDLYTIQFDTANSGPCRVYTIREWLTQIYEQKKDPSKSEFDMDYYEDLRERRKLEKFSDKQIAELSQDRELKLEYEIKNMFRYNTRIASGRISTFVPFLYQEVFYSRVKKAFHSAREINAAVNRLLAVDYSIFYRERMYSDEANGIKKEYIMEEVFPDIILLPVCGAKGVMWQEISGRKRNTPGRFLIPVLTEENLENMLLELFGRFRWELCRTIQGTAWNNIQYPSLTSEYVDYIQFYHKNRDLSTEKKEKLKSQIARGRGNTREIFLIDYIAWVTREYRGEIRLNKVARGLIATYVPFPQEIREKVTAQPIFKDALARFERERQRKVRELELRIRALEKDRIQVPDVVLDTLAFYKDR